MSDNKCICQQYNIVFHGFCPRHDEEEENYVLWVKEITTAEKIKEKCPIHGIKMICGDPDAYDVCDKCFNEGYRASGGIGDGMIHVSNERDPKINERYMNRHRPINQWT